MRVTRFLLPLWLVSCAGTPPPPPPPTCSASTCAGCCDPAGVCQSGNTPEACGAQGAACAVCDGVCTTKVCDSTPQPFPAGAKFVFVTSTGYTGALSGPAHANQLCAASAAAAGLPGTFVAWLSGTACSPSQTVYSALDAVTGNGPWYLTCRDAQHHIRLAFANRAQLQTTPSVPLECDEHGALKNTAVWTGTANGGTAAPYAQCYFYSMYSCSPSWTEASPPETASAGDSSSTTRWTDYGGQGCEQHLSLYCFQI